MLAHGRVVAEGSAADVKRNAELLEVSYLGEHTDLEQAELARLL